MEAGISGTTGSLEQKAESETGTQSMESAIELQPVDAQPLDSETGVQSLDAQLLDSETGVPSVGAQPLESETRAPSVGAQPLDSETGVQSVDSHPWDNETGVQPVNAHPLDNETGTRPIEATSMDKPSPTTREEALESVPEFSSPSKPISELSDVSLESNTPKERAIDSSLDREEVRMSKVVATNRKNIPHKKNRLEPLKMDMSKPVVMPLTSSQLSLQCLECHIIFSDSKSKERHLKQSHPAEYEQCMLGDALFACYVCDRQFTNSTDLMTHQRAHTEKQPFKCPLCGEAFRRSSELTLHKKVHMGQNGYSCLECGKPFKTLTLLKYHCRTHTGEKPYVCKECGKRFTMSIALQRHQRSHLLEGSIGNDEIKTAKAQLKKNNDLSAVKYPCSICKANFKTAKTRMHHMKRKHSLTEPSVGQQIKMGMPIITSAPMCPPNFTHLETLGPLQQVDNIDTEQIRKLIESLGNVQRVNKVVILGQVPPHAQPLDLQRIQGIGEPLQLHLTQPQIELVELKGPRAKDTKLIELEPTVMPCQDIGTSTNSLEPVSLDVQMDPSILLTHAGEYAVPGQDTEQTTVEPQQMQTFGGEFRPQQSLEPTTAVQTAGRHPVNQCISQSEAAELEQAPEQTIVLHLTSLVPTLDLEQFPTVQQELVSSSSLVPTTELEQSSAQPLDGPYGTMSVPTLTPTVELELTTSSLVHAVTISQSPPDEVDQTDQGQETTTLLEMERKVQVNATRETHSAKQTGELAVQDSADTFGEREELLGKSCDGEAQPDSKNSREKPDLQLNMLQASLPPQETKQIKPVSQLPMNVMSVQEFVKVRKRKQATLQQHLEATQNVKKPTKGKKTKKARLVVKFGPKEKEKKSKKPKPSQPVKLPHKQKQTQGKNEMFVSMHQEKKVASKQKAMKEKKDKKQKKMISKSEIKSTNTLHSLQVQQMQGQPRKKKMKRQKDICEGLEKITEQETITSLKPKKKSSEQMSKQEMITSPKSQNKNNKTILHKGEPKKTKDGLLPGKERKRKLAETKLKTSSLSADKPDQKIVQQSLLLLKGHKQPQLKVYKLDATQAPDEPPHGESTTTSLQSKDNTLEQRQKGTKSKTMLKTGVKKNVGRPRKNQKVLSLLPALFTSVSTETQPSKPKATRKRSAPSKVETEGVISSHSRRALACKDCGESFSEVSTLQVHKATMHAVQSPELTYTNGNIFEGVTGSDLCKPQKVSEKSFERKLNQNAFDMHVASDWDMEAEVGEMVSGDKEGRVSFPALNPSPSLPLAFAAVEGDAYEQRSLQSHDDPPEHSTLSHSPPQIVSPGSFISDQVKTILSGQSPPHLKPIETLDRSHQTQQSDTGEHMAGEDKPESQDHLEEDTPKLFLPSDCTSEHQAPVEEEIKEELLLDVNLVTVGEQNEREGQNLAHASSSKNIDRDSQMLDPSSQCEVENNQEPVAYSRDRNVRTSETRPNTQSFSSSTKPPEIKQEEEETLVQKKVVGKKGVRQKNLSRGKRRASGRGRRSLDGLKRVRSDKDTEECQVVYPQHSLTIDSEVNDAVEAGAPQPCQSAAPSLEPEICSRSEPHKDVACATSAPSLPYFPGESPEEQVVFELESVTTSVEEVLKSEEGLRIEVVGEQDRNDGQSPGIILERFLTSRQRDGEDDLQCSDLNLIPHTSQSIPSLEQQCQQSIKSVLVKQEINLNQNDNQDTQGLRHTHNASGLQTDVGERIGSSTVSLDSSVRQCIFYPVKEEEREVLLEQCHPGASSSPVQRGQFVEHQAMPSSGGLYEISSAESEPHVTRGRGMAISDSEEGELDTEQQDTSKLLEFLLNSSDEEDSVNIEFPDPYPEPEVLVKAGLQNGQKHGQLHTNETANNLPASSHPAHLRPTTGSPYTQRDEQGNDFGKPIDYFLKYFGQDTWADIANCTNKTSDLQNPVTAKEVSQFVGIHIAMGTLKFPSLKLYWQDFTKVPLIAEAMSASRYSQLSCKLKLASSPLDSVRHVRHDKDRSKSQADSNSSTYMSRYPGSDENRAPETPSTDPLAGPARPGSESSGHSCTSHSQIQDQSPKLVPSRNSVANGNGQSCADQQNCHTVKIDPLWRVRPLLHRIQAGCLMLRQEGDHGVDQYSIPLTARAGNYNNNQPSLHSTVLVGSSGMILNLDLSLDLSEKEATVEKMVPRDGMVYLCKQELSTPAMLERLLGAGVHGAGKVGGARGQIGDEFVSSDGKLMLRRSHYGFILSTIGKGQQYMASLVNNFDQAEKAAQLNRDLRNLYRTPHSSSAPSSWPQVVLWYLTDVALVNSWLHYRQGRGLGPELLNLMAFRLEVSKALILSSGSDTQDSVPPQPPAQTLHTQGALSNPSLLQVGPLPDPSIRYDGSGHWPEQLGEGEEGRCRFGGCERTSRVRCLKCCVFLCISRNHNCFLNFHSHGFF